jgi:4'-phosphopantetheinyl transferase
VSALGASPRGCLPPFGPTGPVAAPLGFEPFVLPDHEVQVWCLASSAVLDEHCKEVLGGLLQREERDRAATFRFARDRQTFLLTRGLVRLVLSACTDIPPQDLRFRVNAHGKPELADGHPAARRVSFNLSHTEGMIALGLLRRGAIGIDAEKISARGGAIEIANRFFAAAEIDALRWTPASERESTFFRYWTLKEAYVKARGSGLSAPLDQFAFRLDSRRRNISLSPAPGDRASAWKFWQLADRDHRLAVCAEQGPEVALRLRVRRVGEDWGLTDAALDLLGESHRG